jgi:hypothetical protein
VAFFFDRDLSTALLIVIYTSRTTLKDSIGYNFKELEKNYQKIESIISALEIHFLGANDGLACLQIKKI